MKFKMTPNKLMIALFAAIITVVPVVTAATPKLERSENENRMLQKVPTLINEVQWEKAETFGDKLKSIKWKYINNREGKAFKDDFEKYFCDHLMGRETWVKVCNRLQMMAGKQEINEVYTLDDQMVQAFKGYDSEDVERAIGALNLFAERHPDMQVSMMLAPTAQEFFSNKLPSYAGLLSEKNFIDDVYKSLDGITPIDCLSQLAGHSNEYIYYRTDHHWTSLGAYYAYGAAAKTLGYGALGTGAFNIETASSDFRGTLFSKTLDDRITPDEMNYYIPASGEQKVTMICRNGAEVNTYDSLYVREFLDQKDKYSSFTGSNVPIVDITTEVDNGKSLLIIKDSYAHSLVPFLANHYSRITMVDMRYIKSDLGRFIKLDEYDQALIMYNVITFAQDAQNVNTLRLTK